MEKKLIPSNKEFVIMSVNGYKKIANIDYTGKNLYWTTDMNTEVPVKLQLQCPKNELILPKTVSQCFLETCEKFPNLPCCHCEATVGNWKSWTWSQVKEICFGFAKSLVACGVSKRSAVNIIGFNSPEWIFSFYGAILADCIAVGVYSTNSPGACQYVAEHSCAEIVFAENEKQLKKYLEVVEHLPNLKAIVVWGETSIRNRPENIKVLTWNEFMQLGVNIDKEENGRLLQIICTRIEEQIPGMCCNIVYTSGTTGNPKGVMLNHDNIYFTTLILMDELKHHKIEEGKERVVSFLPLSHIAAQVFDITINLIYASQLYFARPDALQGSLVETLQHARPTMFLGVPRVWEKLEERLKELSSQSSMLLQKIAAWAKGKGYQNAVAKMAGKGHPFGYSLAHFLVLGKIKKALGLDMAKIYVVGAAPIKASTFEYFASLDMPIINIFGMSESTGPTTYSRAGKFKKNTIGYAFRQTDLKIDIKDKTKSGNDAEGEVCFRGRNNFIGYLNNDKATKETLDQDGYIHSGDLGVMDSDGFVRITGRIKELIITAGGENVAPVLIEDSLKNLCPIISNVMIVGDAK